MSVLQQLKTLRDRRITELKKTEVVPGFFWIGKDDQSSQRIKIEIARYNEQIRRIESGGEYCRRAA
jgi:hypothetical protein